MFRKVPLCLLIVVVALATALLVLAEPRKGGVKYALLIGVRVYDPEQLRNLPYAEPDVTELAKVLLEQGYRKEHVVLMTQTVAAEKPRFNPLAANIHAELKKLLELCEEEDSVLLAFAGHGVQFKTDKENYFCPADAKLSDKKTLISLGEVYKQLGDEKKCKAKFKLLLADCCRNDPRSANARAREEVDVESVTRPQKQELPRGVAAFFSCSEGRVAHEHESLKHGVFFHFVIKGLRGEAGDRQGRVTLPDLEKYVKEEVKTFLFDKDLKQQYPELRNQSNDVMELVRVTASKTIAVDLGGGVKMEFVRIPAGKFRMGSKDEKERGDDEEQHEVEITRAFYLGKYEVTQEQYQQIVGANPSWFSAGGGGKEKVKDVDTRRFPVEQVSWEDATAYCAKLTARDGRRRFGLPSEAEWEYACRAGKATPFHFGSSLNGDKANCDSNHPYGTAEKGRRYLGRTCLVGSYADNGFGLHDMHGNVWEWCQDWYGPYSGLLEKDPLRTEKVDDSARVLRGGSWNLNARYCRAANRNWTAPGYRDLDVGFRVAFRLD